MTNHLTTVDIHALAFVSGGAEQSTLGKVGGAVSSGYNAAKNFGSGFAAGATFGPNARTENVEKYGNSSQTGFKPGVETGMMFNMALGPAGRAISAVANRVPGGSQ